LVSKGAEKSNQMTRTQMEKIRHLITIKPERGERRIMSSPPNHFFKSLTLHKEASGKAQQ